MNKYVLVIDNPQKCEECQLCKNYIKAHHAWGNSDTYEVHCAGIANRTLMEVPKDKKPDWCPLREIPQKYETVSMDFERGYNACIDELLEENI